MSRTIHPSAVIDASAEIAEGVQIGPFCVVGPRCRIGQGTRLRSHVVIGQNTMIGQRCDIHPGAVIGGEPQDLKFQGEESVTILGDRNIVRECVTINRGTELGGGKTALGNGNLIMAYVHIAHDCIIGDSCILNNNTQLAGHIKVEDGAIISGLLGIHHFVTIGAGSFVAALSAVRTDVPPFMIVEGNPARVRKLNLEGLRRRNVPAESIRALKTLFRLVYRDETSRAEAITRLEASEVANDPYVRRVIEHYRASEAGVQGRALEVTRRDKPVGRRA